MAGLLSTAEMREARKRPRFFAALGGLSLGFAVITGVYLILVLQGHGGGIDGIGRDRFLLGVLLILAALANAVVIGRAMFLPQEREDPGPIP